MLTRSFQAILGLVLISSCGSLKAPKPEEKVSTFTPPQTKGTIQVPIEVDLKFVFTQLDKKIPKQFTGEKDQCEGVSFAYTFDRYGVSFTGQKNGINTQVQGAYMINANYCVHCSSAFGKDPFCIVPRIYVSCGDNEPMRRVQLDFATQLSVDKAYKINSTTNLKGIKSLDPCEFTFLKYDASKLIEKEISKALKGPLQDLDKEIQKVNFRPKVEDMWELAQKPINIPGIGFLLLNPKQVSLNDLNFSNSKVNTKVQLDLSPQIVSSLGNSSTTSLPPLGKPTADTGFSIPLNIDLSYDSLNLIIQEKWKPLQLKQGKKTLQIDQLRLLGPDENYLFVQVEFSGSKKGTLFLKGKPVYTAETGLLSLTEIDYDLETKNILLKSGSWLFESKLQKTLEEKLIFDLRVQLDNFKERIEKELNREIKISNEQKAYLKGNLELFDLSYIHPNTTVLQLGLNLKGDATIIVR